MNLYRQVVRPLLFRADPEWVHDCTIRVAELGSASRWLCSSVAAWNATSDERLAIDVAGLRFGNPLGLAAGFDKNGRAAPLLAALGFGHVEIGSISAKPSAGNPRPRLFRLPADKGIVVNYGLPNDGAERVAERLVGRRPAAPLGINIVSTNFGPSAAPVSTDEVLDDYFRSVQRLRGAADYLCLNLSCPNTREGRGFFAELEHLARLLEMLDETALEKPLFLKVAPFASERDLEALLAVVDQARCVSGFAINLAPGKPSGLTIPAAKLQQMPGAVSGKPCEAATNVALRELYRRMDRRRYRIIAAGGIFSAEDAYRKIRLGASLVQIMTGLIYEGPGLVKAINERLGSLLERDGFGNVAEAVGVDAFES